MTFARSFAFTLALTSFSLAILACDKPSAPPPSGGAGNASSTGSSAKAPTPSSGEPSKPDPLAMAASAVEDWKKAQNDGKFEAYLAKYDASFQGIKRTPDGGEKKLDLATWKTDREKMFKIKQEVAVENIKSTMSGNDCVVTFLQRWKSGRFADHGEKTLTFRDSGSGMRIVREEMKWSERGYEDSKTPVVDATALTSPLTLTLSVKTAPKNESDCLSSTMVLTLKDAKGVEKTFEHGTITSVAEDNQVKAGAVKPSGDHFESLGQYCAGLQQGYTVKVSGDTIEAVETWNDEEGGPGKANQVIAKLPAGAVVTLK